MPIRTMTPVVWGLALLSCVPAWGKSSHRTEHRAHGGNCVAYARDVTGIKLDGNAGMWWAHAEGRYERGHRPAPGAILVFKPYGRMRLGHVAVVSRIVGPREILVDQANWVRGRVTTAMSVVDASRDNDWTAVKVLEPHSGTHGRDNPTFGFIYPGMMGHEDAPLVTAAKPARPPRRPHAQIAVLTSLAAPDAGRRRNKPPDAARSYARTGHAEVLVSGGPHRHGRARADKLIVFY